MYFQTLIRQLVITFTFLMFISPLPAQTVKELENQRKQTLQKLETTSKILNETKKSQRSSLNKLVIINKDIKERKVLIKTISSEIGQLDNQMNRLGQEKTILENRLKVLKLDYAKLVQEAYINRDLYAKIMFVLSANSFDQSYRRLRYMQEYSQYRKVQVGEIEKVTAQIQVKNDSLQSNKVTKVDVVKQKETETQKLSKDEKKEKVLLTDLQKKEKKLRADLKIQQKKANDLNNKIEKIIAEEIRKAEAKRVAAEAKRVAAENSRIATENKRIAAENKIIAEQNKKIAAENKAKEAANLAAKEAAKTSPKTAPKTTPKQEPKPLIEPKPAIKEIPVIAEAKSTQSTSVLTKEETLLSGDFQRNIGRLPWPTSNGFIRGHFGVQPHPVLKYVTTNNKGIYIQTPSGSTARAVFEGIVTQRFSIPGSNNAVIIKHGNYRTVYANLTQIFVSEGDKVSAKQAIGKIYTDDENDNKTELYFQVWNGKNLQNPESWIAR